MEDFQKHMHVQVWHQWLQKFPSSLMLNIAHIHAQTYSCRIHMPAQQDKLLHSHCCSMIWPVTMNNTPLHSYKETTGKKNPESEKRQKQRLSEYSTGMTSWRQIQSSSQWMTDCKPVKFCLWIHPWPSKKIYFGFDLFSCFSCLSLLTVFVSFTFRKT